MTSDGTSNKKRKVKRATPYSKITIEEADMRLRIIYNSTKSGLYPVFPTTPGT